MPQPATRLNARRVSVALLLGLAVGAAALPADRPTHLIVPYPPGGPLDSVARALADALRDSLGVVVVDNRPGAGGNLGADLVAKAAPDGATLVIGAVATHAINPWLYRSMPYDALRDFTPITGLARVPNVLVMNTRRAAALGIASVADLVAYARRHPGALNYGSGGNGSAGHLAGELFKSQAGVSMVHIPYPGGNAAELALLSGQVDLTFDNLASAAANIRAGTLRALAVTTPTRSSAMPELPTLGEAGRPLGLARFDVDTWFGVFAPARLPASTTQRLNAAFVRALNTPAVRALLQRLMAEPMPSSPAAFAAFVAREHARYRDIVHASGASTE